MFSQVRDVAHWTYNCYLIVTLFMKTLRFFIMCTSFTIASIQNSFNPHDLVSILCSTVQKRSIGRGFVRSPDLESIKPQKVYHIQKKW